MHAWGRRPCITLHLAPAIQSQDGTAPKSTEWRKDGAVPKNTEYGNEHSHHGQLATLSAEYAALVGFLAARRRPEGPCRNTD